MTVAGLRAMCAKLFKVELLKCKMVFYSEDEYNEEYELEEDIRLLSYYGIRDGGKIVVGSN